MNLNTQIEKYLDRIGFHGSLDGSAKTLADLQERHLHTVPYENLDILEGRALSLDPQELYQKIVIRQRGGYCFETNALFGWLLRELGYTVTDLVARFWRDEPNLPPKRRHHVLKVEAEGAHYLCDVGVGGIVPRRPLSLSKILYSNKAMRATALREIPRMAGCFANRRRKHGIASTLSLRSLNCRKTTYSRVSGVKKPQIRFSTSTRSLRYARQREGIHLLTRSSAYSALQT